MGDALIHTIQQAARQLYPEVLQLRRVIHMHPELSFEEKETSVRIQHFLSQHNIAFTTGWAGHGVVAVIRGETDGPVVMLRADMDALPILEENDAPYQSVNKGIMHACGHDVHTSCLLGAAAILQQNKKHLKGEIRFVFQPGEEKLPGGASLMIREGLFAEKKPQAMIAQHVHPPLEAGHVGFRDGLYMASADEIYITINGKGGHAASPHLCIDPIVIASSVVIALQQIISRQIDPLSPGVLTIGKIYSDGGATNVIPNRVYLEGTLRAMDETWRMETHTRIHQTVENICKAFGGVADIRIEKGYPCLMNDPQLTEQCRSAAIRYLGPDRVHDLPQRMGSEDFAFYSQQVPSTFYRLGTGWADASRNYPIHSSRFDINEIALETGMGLMAYLALTSR